MSTGHDALWKKETEPQAWCAIATGRSMSIVGSGRHIPLLATYMVKNLLTCSIGQIMVLAAIGSSMSRGLDALVGAAVTIVLLAFIPFSPLVGGAVAGYLHQRDGVMIGTLAGVFALLPAFFLFGIIGIGALGIGLVAPLASGIAILILLFAFMFILAYVLGLSAAGGAIGVYLYQRLQGD